MKNVYVLKKVILPNMTYGGKILNITYNIFESGVLAVLKETISNNKIMYCGKRNVMQT